MTNEELNENINSGQSETENLKDEEKRLQAEVERLTNDVDELGKLTEAANAEFKNSSEKLTATKTKLSEAENLLSAKEGEIAKKQELYKSLDEEFKNKENALNGVLNERKKLIESAAVEREKIAKEISVLLDGLKSDITKEGSVVTGIYKKTADAANEQLMSAIAEGEKLLEKLRADIQLFVRERENLASETLEKRKKILREADELRETKHAEIIDELNAKIDSVYEKQQHAEKLRLQNEQLQNILKSRENAISSAVEAEVERRIGEIISENEVLKTDSEKYLELYKNVLQELNEARRTVKMTEGEEKKNLIEQNKLLIKENKELRLKTNADYMKDDILLKANSYAALKEANEKHLSEIERLTEQVFRLQCAEGLNTVLTDIAKESSEKIDELRELVEKFKKDEYSQEYRKKPIVEPIFKSIEKDLYLYTKNEDINELDWLENISNGIKSEGFEFSTRLLIAFHTCVKTAIWSPVTVLAGASGTGKSELPRLYAQYGGMYFMNVAVRPDWDSPSSMLGYYNALERRFEAKPLIRGMYQMQDKEGSFSKRLAVFLLDEMNLSHVELYFSDMLSKLEENRNKKSSNSVSLEIDLGAGVPSLPIKLTHNMFWVGTMNEDETTKSLSDKVIDRSNIIVFPRPEQLVSRAIDYTDREPMLLKKETWDAWCQEELKLVNATETFGKMLEKYKDVIVRINEKLENGGRALGHRVWQSIQHYMAAHPYVIKEFNSSNGVENDNLKKALDGAFAEAVAFKVMPKLRGLETEGNSKRDCLDPIGEIIGREIPDLKQDYDLACKSVYGVFMWKSGKFLEDSKENTDDKKN